MRNGRFEYFLNAVFYCLWLRERKFGDYVAKYLCYPFLAFIKKFISRKRGEMAEEQYKLYRESVSSNAESGSYIGFAKDTFRTLNILYSCLFAFAFLGVGFRIQGMELSLLMKFVAVLPPVFAYDIFLRKFVMSDDKYLEYFWYFENQDDQWLRKWKRITVAYCFGAVLSAGMGVLLMAAIMLWR